eukprot:5892795-Amphidinium_carterae.1
MGFDKTHRRTDLERRKHVQEDVTADMPRRMSSSAQSRNVDGMDATIAIIQPEGNSSPVVDMTYLDVTGSAFA